MSHFSATVAALVALLASTSALAGEPTAMFVPKAINLDPVQTAAFGTVCAAQYASVSQSSVVGPVDAQAAVGPNGSLLEAARTLNARELVELTLVNLGTNTTRGRLVIDAVRRAADGTELYRTTLTADSLDDALPACQRLALSLTQRTPIAETLNRTNVTAAEAKASRKPNRVGSEKVIGVKAAFAQPVASGALVNPLGALLFDVRLEQPRYFIELGVGVLVPAAINSSGVSYGGIITEVGASYYLTEGDIAPYVGAGLQPRVFFTAPVLNLAPYVQVGLMLWRESSTRLYIDARVSQNVLPVVNQGFSGIASVYPTELGVQVGVGW